MKPQTETLRRHNIMSCRQFRRIAVAAFGGFVLTASAAAKTLTIINAFGVYTARHEGTFPLRH
jgi:hypothetical protein